MLSVKHEGEGVSCVGAQEACTLAMIVLGCWYVRVVAVF